MSEERLQRERTKGLRALTPPCPRLQAKKLQPLPTSQRKPSTGRLPPCKVWNVSKLVGSRGGRNVWKRAMTVGSGIIGSCIVGLHKASVTTAGPRVNKRHLTWEVPPFYFCWSCRQKILALKRVLSTNNIRSGQSFVLQVEVEGTLLAGRCSSWGVLRFGGCQ